MTPSARTIWGSKRKIFRGQYNIGARGQFALDFPSVGLTCEMKELVG